VTRWNDVMRVYPVVRFDTEEAPRARPLRAPAS
jgi:hypothetical protein